MGSSYIVVMRGAEIQLSHHENGFGRRGGFDIAALPALRSPRSGIGGPTTTKEVKLWERPHSGLTRTARKMAPRQVSVHLTETSLNSSRGFLAADDVNAIVLDLSLEPMAGTAVEGVPHLRQVTRTAIATGHEYQLWFLSFPDGTEVKVVGITQVGSDQPAPVSERLIWRILKAELLMRLARKAYELSNDFIDYIQ